MATSLARIIQQHTIANNVRFALRKIAPATKADQRLTVAYLRRYKEGENNPNEKCNKSLDYENVKPRVYKRRAASSIREKEVWKQG